MRIPERFLEIIPGTMVWITLVVAFLASLFFPLAAVMFILLFDLYWLFRVLYFLPYLILSWKNYHAALQKDWAHACASHPGFERIYHLIFLPTYQEEIGVIRETLRTLARSSFPANRMIIVLAGEARDAERFRAISMNLTREFEHVFFALWVTEHPSDLPDEIPGKGSNLNYSGKTIFPEIQKTGIPIDDIIVSSFDVDTIVHPQYFSCLGYTYLTTPEPTRASYQPVPLYNNNVWESPAVVRVAMFGTTFWLMTELARPEGMMTFSSHSMSLRMLTDVGFWQKDIVSEDSRIFLQALTYYHGDYRVIPLYLPVSMDTVMTGNYRAALIALYKQQRRWAWGVENFPYMVRAFASDRIMPLRVKAAFLWKQIEGMYTWATAPFLITVMGYLPFWLAPQSVREATLFQNTPFTLQWLMRGAMIGAILSAGMAWSLLPARPKQIAAWKSPIVTVLQWVLLPVTFVLFGAFPAIDAQTRFMLGKKLGFNVSPKRKSSE